MNERKIIYLEDAIGVLEERLQANGHSNTVLVSELNRSIGYLMQLPPAQPETHYDEWCTDCKEYDKEKHSCPRWNRVIQNALRDVQPKRKKAHWIDTGSGQECSACHEIQYGHDSFRFFCARCGADMRGDPK